MISVKNIRLVYGFLCNNAKLRNRRTYSAASEVLEEKLDEASNYVDFSPCSVWENDNDNIKTIKKVLIKDMKVLENFVDENEENSLVTEIDPFLKRRRYEFDHWDDAIHGYRELEQLHWSDNSSDILQRARNIALANSKSKSLPHVHILDLDGKGYIKPHVDAVRFCGSTVAGICLLSPAVMRLRHSEITDLFVDFLLPQRSFYIMTDSARFNFSHEILKNEISYFRQRHIVRGRRISLIIRNFPSAGS